MVDHDFWNKRRVLVTGGSGFLGSHLSRRLAHHGAEVYATSRVQRPPNQKGPIWWHTDLTSLDQVRGVLSKYRPEVIYHLAGSVGASPDKGLVVPTFHSLLLTTINLLIAAADLRCRRIILAGSLTEPEPGETHPTPSSPYAAAKWAASGYGRMFHSLYGTPTVVLIPFMTFGPGQHPQKLIPSVILSLLKGEGPRLTSGRWEADWVYVDDVVQGFLAAAESSGAEGKTFDIGSGRTRSVRSLVEQVVEQMETHVKPEFGALPDRPMEPIRVADAVRTQRELGWKCTTALEEGLKRTIDWYAANHQTASRD
jgi:nucleoside-diphosphate-sugar epimerase